jgi:hypothetical protein
MLHGDLTNCPNATELTISLDIKTIEGTPFDADLTVISWNLCLTLVQDTLSYR